jgi:hypothetical protein
MSVVKPAARLPHRLLLLLAGPAQLNRKPAAGQVRQLVDRSAYLLLDRLR